jgi:hypothetical protein
VVLPFCVAEVTDFEVLEAGGAWLLVCGGCRVVDCWEVLGACCNGEWRNGDELQAGAGVVGEG